MSCEDRSRAQLQQSPARGRHAAITVMQPYAWLLAHAPEWPTDVLGKTVENRSRSTEHRGPVLIHVSRRWERVAEQLDDLRKLGLVGGRCPEPTIAELRVQLGQAIAVARIVGCRYVGTDDPHPWAAVGSWAWELADVQLIMPLPLRGNTGLWYTPAHLEVRRLTHEVMLDGTTHVVSSWNQAVCLASRVGVRRLEQNVRVDGDVIAAGELWARAAAELGDVDMANRFRQSLRTRLAEIARAHG